MRTLPTGLPFQIRLIDNPFQEGTRKREYRFMVFVSIMGGIFGVPVAETAPFRTMFEGVRELKKLVQIGLAPELRNDGIGQMRASKIPLGIGLLGFIMLPFIIAAKRVIKITDATARSKRTTTAEPQFDIKLVACNGEHHHLGLYQGEKLVEDEIIQIQDGIEPLYTILLRWTIHFGISPQTVAALEQNLYRLLDENAVYTLSLDPGNDLVQSTMLVLKNGGLIDRRTVETPMDILEVLVDTIQNKGIPAIAHIGLLQDAIDIAHSLPQPEPPAPNYTIKVTLAEGKITVVASLDGTGLEATTEVDVNDPLRTDKLTAFIVNTLGVSPDSVLVMEMLRKIDAELDVTAAVSESVDAARTSTDSGPAAAEPSAPIPVATSGDGAAPQSGNPAN